MHSRKIIFVVLTAVLSFQITGCGHTNGQIDENIVETAAPQEAAELPPQTSVEEGTPSAEEPVAQDTMSESPVDTPPDAPPPPHKFKYAIISRAASTYFDDKGNEIVQTVTDVSLNRNGRIEKTEQKFTGLNPSVVSVNYSYGEDGNLRAADIFGASFYKMSFIFNGSDLPIEFVMEVPDGTYQKREYGYKRGSINGQTVRFTNFYAKNSELPDPKFTEKTVFDEIFLPISFEYCSNGYCTLSEYKFEYGALSNLKVSNAGGIMLCDVVYDDKMRPTSSTTDKYEKGFLKNRTYVKAMDWDDYGNVLREEVETCTIDTCKKYAERTFEYHYTDSEGAFLALPIVLKLTLLTPTDGTLLYTNDPMALFGSAGVSLY